MEEVGWKKWDGRSGMEEVGWKCECEERTTLNVISRRKGGTCTHDGINVCSGVGLVCQFTSKVRVVMSSF
jgi:hypothetical protein